ncbi:hypothetical protein WJX81_002940 [Elliptochloris bilobata]|uniref:AP2/ERF domain-containing protein n=1 Tax=Elliptochloris bilobata TaxID=381761 RepID=A0AAW1S4L8_9CHLO
MVAHKPGPCWVELNRASHGAACQGSSGRLDAVCARALLALTKGRGFIRNAEAVEACPVCQQWRAENPLIAFEALDFAAIGESLGGDDGPKKKGRRRKPSANAGRPLSEERKLRISASVRAVLESTPKHCSVCGGTGHNRLTCPVRRARLADGLPEPERKEKKRRKPLDPGHKQRIAMSQRRTREARKQGPGGATTAEPEDPGNAGSGAPTGEAQQHELGHGERRDDRAPDAPRRSMYHGVTWSRNNGKWRAQIWDGERVRSAGHFDDEAAAAAAYDAAALRLRGDRAVLNFPERADAVAAAAAAVERAWADGVRRQRVELLLPQGGVDSEAAGWPGGIRQQFAAARGMVEDTLRQLKQAEGLQGPLAARWLDEADCVGAWEGDKLAAAVFPTADSVGMLREIDGDRDGKRLMLVFNPQWQTDGQIVSDFGFGRGKLEAEAFVGDFQDVCVMQRLRVMGDDVRMFKCYPGDWQVHFMWPNGRGELLTGLERARPGYGRLVALLQRVPGSQAARTWVDRVNPFARGLGSAQPYERPADAQAAARAATDATRFGEVDIITGQPVRDLKMEPVMALRRWLHGSSGGSGSFDDDTKPNSLL